MSTIVAANGNGSIVPPFGKFQFSKEHSGLKEIHHTYFMEQKHTLYAKQRNQFKYLSGRTSSKSYQEEPVQVTIGKNQFK